MRSIRTRSVDASSKQGSVNVDMLYRTQNERLKRFIQKKIWCKEDAEDVLQLTYLEAMRSQENFKGGSKPETWLFGIAVNLTRNYFKRHYSQPPLDEMTDTMLSELQGEVENDPEVLAEHEFTLSQATEAISALPEDIQFMFAMIVDSECSYQDAADRMGVPIGTIRSRLSRARKTLKHHLEV